MSHLSFDCFALASLRDSARERWKLGPQPLYGRETGPGYWLVGDEGVYLMHNGAIIEDIDRQPLAYSKECNPQTNPDWFEVKRDTFGGDDGVEFIEAAVIDKIIDQGADLIIDFEDGRIAYYAATEGRVN